MAEDLTPDSEPQQMTDAEYKKILGAGADGDFDPLSVPPEAGADIVALQTAAARQRMADIAKLPSEITGHTPPAVAAATSEVFQSPAPAPLPEYRQPMGPVADIQPATQPTGAEAAVTAQIPPAVSCLHCAADVVPGTPTCFTHSPEYPPAPPAPPVDTHRPGNVEFLPQPDPARAHVPEQPEKWNAIEASRAPVPARAATQDEIVAYIKMRVKDLEHTKATNQSLGAKDMSAVHRRLEFLRDDILPAVIGLRG